MPYAAADGILVVQLQKLGPQVPSAAADDIKKNVNGNENLNVLVIKFGKDQSKIFKIL